MKLKKCTFNKYKKILLKYFNKIIKKLFYLIKLIYSFIKNRNEREKIISNYKFRFKWRERKECYGNENRKKIFFIIRRISEFEGHFSMINTVLGHLEKADKKKYIPIIDMKNYYSSLWQNEDRKYLENAWEYFYEQPCGYTLNDIKKSKNIIYSQGFYPKNSPSYSDIALNKDKISKLNKLYNKYIILNDKTKKYIYHYIDNYQIKTKSVLAVSIRRGIEWGHLMGYPAYSCYSKHPSLEKVINETKKIFKLWNCEKIFLSIDDQEGLEIFKDVFNGKISYIDRERSEYFKNGKPLNIEERRLNHILKQSKKENLYYREAKYLSEIYIISQCSNLICTNTSANATVLILNGNKFKNVYLFED